MEVSDNCQLFCVCVCVCVCASLSLNNYTGLEQAEGK